MGTVIELPYSVVLYLQLIEGLLRMLDGIDSSAPENKIIQGRIDKYLERIDEEMFKAVLEYES